MSSGAAPIGVCAPRTTARIPTIVHDLLVCDIGPRVLRLLYILAFTPSTGPLYNEFNASSGPQRHCGRSGAHDGPARGTAAVPRRLRRPRRGAVGARRVLRHRQSDLERT